MEKLFSELFNLNPNIVDYFAIGKDIWKQFIKDHSLYFSEPWETFNEDIVKDTSNDLQTLQNLRFEKEFESKTLGQEIMVFIGVLYYYDFAKCCFEDNTKANNLLHLLSHGGLSLELVVNTERMKTMIDIDVN